MHSSNYIIRFVLIMTSVAALVLAALNTVLADRHQSNEKVYNRRAVLAAVENQLGTPKSLDELSDEEVNELFNTKITQQVLNMEGDIIEGKTAESVNMAKEKKKPESERLLPLYRFSSSNGNDYYILSIRGNGLWDEIWGFIAVEDDLRTVAGASFDHTGETPGLGAEIKDNPTFSAQFEGKTIYADNGDYTSVVVRKGGAVNDAYEVDGISGATVTADGVSEMLYRGIRYYEPFFEENSNNSKSENQ